MRLVVAFALIPITLLAGALAIGAILGASSTLVAALLGGAAVVYALIYTAIYRDALARPPTGNELRALLKRELRPPGRP